jgi:hypothetical protein
VQPTDLSLLNGLDLKVLIFLGSNQNKLPVEFVSTIQDLGTNAEYVQISGSGKNALDFHIAFTIGELSKIDPKAYYHIISKDAGYDPLIKHARKKGIQIGRSKTIADTPLARLSSAKSVAEKVESIVRNLKMRGSGRPRKVKTLSNTINALFQKGLEESELKRIVRRLEKDGHISIEGDNVSYHLSSAP